MSSPFLQYSATQAANEAMQQPPLKVISNAQKCSQADADSECGQENADANSFNAAVHVNNARSDANASSVKDDDGSKTANNTITPKNFTKIPAGEREDPDDLQAFLRIMQNENQRLLTFQEGRWPIKFVSKESLANAGFFYLQNSDRVQCPFCKGVIRDWEIGDVPLQEHRRHFPRCPFICGYSVGNVAITKDPVRRIRQGQQRRSQTSDVCGGYHSLNSNGTLAREESFLQTYTLPLKSNFLPNYQETNVKEFGVIIHKAAVSSKYVSRDSRTSSFLKKSAFTLKCVVKFGSQKIAEAGFYYSGSGEYVKCFCCGVMVRDDDLLLSLDPWASHASRSPHCNFLLLNKGIRFVNSVEKVRDTSCNASKNEQKTSSKAAKDFSLQYSEDELGAVFAQTTICDEVKHFQKNCSQSTECLANGHNVTDVTENETRRRAESIHAGENECMTPSLRRVASAAALSNVEVAETTLYIAEAAKCTSSNAFTSPAINEPTAAFTENDRLLCKTCFDSEIGVALLPCGHVACTQCAPAFTLCPVCRSRIRGTVRTYFV